MTRRAICYNMCFELGPKRKFWRSYGHLKNLQFVWWLWWKPDLPWQNYNVPFAQKLTPAINFWTLKIGLSCSARVRRLTGILRRAHVTIFIVDYGDFRSQLSGFSRIFEDFDWAPVIFTQDVQRKTYGILLWKYFFPKIKNRSRWSFLELSSRKNYRDRTFENFPRFL